MKTLLLTTLVLAAWSCSPPCAPVNTPVPPQRVCHRADAGAITPDVPFVLEATTGLESATCRVSIDAGQLDLFVDGTAACAGGSAFAERAVPFPVRCVIPALPAGTYSVNTSPALTFSIPDAGVAPCD